MAGQPYTAYHGTARFFFTLGVYDFIKRSPCFYTGKALKAIGDIIEFADKEGFTAHANSVKVRFEK